MRRDQALVDWSGAGLSDLAQSVAGLVMPIRTYLLRLRPAGSAATWRGRRQLFDIEAPGTLPPLVPGRA